MVDDKVWSNNWVKSSGVLLYDPDRGTMKSNTQWWAVLKVCDDIAAYYRWWLQSERHVHLHQPAWGGHISVVRGERPRNQSEWKKYHGKRIEFEYLHGHIGTTPDKDAPGNFHWIYARCAELDEIRKELGLAVGWSYHITVGRNYY